MSFLLAPFRRWFKPPVLETPLSTIPVPPISVLMVLIFASFSVITSGFIFCLVRGMPMTGYIRTKDGGYRISWIDLNSLSNQFLAEGIVAAFMFSLDAASLISVCYIMSKDEDEQLSDWEAIVKKFAYTSPIWTFLSYKIFSAKFRAFSIRFSAH